MKLWGGNPEGRRSAAEIKQPQPPKKVGDASENSFGHVPSSDWEQDWDALYRQARTSAGQQSAPPKGKAPGKKRKKKARRLFCLLAFLLFSYWIAVYSPLPIISDLRALYIETAMGTMTHQWLATAFIPRPVIDKVMQERGNLDEQQEDLMSQWELKDLPGTDEISAPWQDVKDRFFKVYTEIDKESFEAYIDKSGPDLLDENNRLFIDKAGRDEQGTSIKTTRGDKVLALDTVHGITIAKVEGDGYVGRIAIIKDPSTVGLGLAKGFGTVGSTIGEIAEYQNAVLGINASGFYDPEGHGNGGGAYGLVLSKGKVYSKMVGLNDKVIAFDETDKLNIGKFNSVKQFRDGVEFKPALIINGETVVKGSSGWGVQPRTAIGQTQDGQVLFLVVDGRAPGYSIGCTVGEAAEILADYGAWQACNLDGGSSSILYYNGREISFPSAADKEHGRRLPNAFLVYKK